MYSVIIVDDEPIIKKSLGKLIELYCPMFKVVAEADDGKTAYELTKELLPDLVITDIRMPVMDGLEFGDKVKKLSPATDIVIVSGYGEFNYAQHAIRNGSSDYLLKPIKPDSFINTMKKIEERKRRDKLPNHERSQWMWKCKSYCEQLVEAILELNTEQCLYILDQLDQDILKTQSGKTLKQRYMDLSVMLQEGIGEKVPNEEMEKEHTLEFLNESHNIADDFAHLVLYMIENLRQSRNWGSFSKVKQAVQYIDDDFCKPNLTLQEVAEFVEMSPNYFSRVFKEETGTSFINYLTKKRMNKAKKLLNDPARKAYEIALDVGYSDYPHFAKTFKKTFKVSPLQYRKQQLK